MRAGGGSAIFVTATIGQDVGELVCVCVCGCSVRIAPHLEQSVGTNLDADGSGIFRDNRR